jgi:hypothetical protein
MFNILWSRLVSWLLPWFLRTVSNNDWLNALTAPLVQDWQDFLVWKDEMIYEAYMTGQVINLEMLLNDKFNGGLNAWNFNGATYTYDPNTPNAIYILDNPDPLPSNYLWTTAENRIDHGLWTTAEDTAIPPPPLPPPFYLFTNAEYNQQADFIVYVPTSLANVMTDIVFITRMKGWIDKYRQAGSRYKIVNY